MFTAVLRRLFSPSPAGLRRLPFAGRLALLAAVTLAAVPVRAQSLPVWRETTPTAALAGAAVTGLAYGQGLFVLAASSNSPVADFLLTSPDGVTWTRRNLPTGGSGIRQVRFVNGRFWTVGGNGGGTSTVYSSADGLSWTAVQTVTIGGIGTGGGLVDLAYGNGRYVAALDAGWIVSADGTSWTARPTPTPTGGSSLSGATGIAFENGVFVATFASVSTATSVFRSTDGLTWTPVPTLTAFGGYSRVVAFNRQFVTYDRANTNIATFGQALVSSDGLTWTRSGTTNNATASSGVTAVGPGYRVTAAGVSGLGTFRIATTADNARFTEIGVMPFNRNVDRGFAVGETAIVGFTSTSQVVVGDAPAAAPVAPTVSTPPVSQTVPAGGSVTFTVGAAGGGLSYQWLFNNTPLAGATAASLTLNAVSDRQAGSYTVRIANSVGTIVSPAATLVVGPALAAGNLTNLSIRCVAGAGDRTLIVGFNVGGVAGPGTKDLLIRAVGPTLAGLGVGGTLADPRLDLYSGSTVLAGNDNWDAAATPAAIQAGVGAFALAAGSRDAALVRRNLGAGGYTVQITDTAGGAGVALAELYDLSAAATGSPRLVNISARAPVGRDEDVLIAGFNVSGPGSRRVLLRAVGPGLAAFGLDGLLADPRLDLYSGSTVVAANDNWEAAAVPPATQAAVGAFALPAGSRDAVLIATLAPGAYTAQVSGADRGTGIALVEVYELP
jgi:hypothetical protein